jgi:beta-barrel assembly-enhancing protease
VSGLFYNFGRMLGPHVRKARWLWQSVAGDEADAMRLEREVGSDLARGIRQQLKVDTDPQIAQLLNEVGSRLTACVANKLRSFGFEALEGGQPNAFALPGGYIFVTRSLVELCERNQDEIAFILGHEMSHVIRGHAMDRIITNSAISLGTKLTSVRGPITGLLSNVGVRLLESSYSQDLEMEADKLGALLVDAAGYNPKAAAVMLSRLAQLNPSGAESGIGHYFSSHPAINLRIKNIRGI